MLFNPSSGCRCGLCMAVLLVWASGSFVRKSHEISAYPLCLTTVLLCQLQNNSSGSQVAISGKIMIRMMPMISTITKGMIDL